MDLDIKKGVQSKTFKWVLYSIGIFLILVIVFRAGMFVGFYQAKFLGNWNNNYSNNFIGPREGFGRMGPGGTMDFRDDAFFNSHGVVGSVLKTASSSFIIVGNDGVEKKVIVGKETSIRKFRDEIKVSDIIVDDQVVVFGAPNSAGQIEARLIRIAPMPMNGKALPKSFIQ
ncbi:MAG: hypothetical protein WC757_00995 [Candidatus Paceibacterota bacterium]|jgi:hypothetical protein